MRRSIILLAIFIPIAFSLQESLKTRLNRRFFDFFSKYGHRVVDREVVDLRIPEIKIPLSTIVGNGYVKTTELIVKKFKTPNISFELLPDGIGWTTNGGAVRLAGLWEANFADFLSDSGWLNVFAADIAMSIGASAYELDGKPQIKIGDCDVAIGYLNVEIGGSVVSWLVNLLQAPLSLVLKQVIHKKACSLARTILIDEANRIIRSLPSHIDVGHNFFVDYRLVRNPHSVKDFVEFDMIADVVYGNMSCMKVEEVEWTESGPNPGMITTWMSQLIPNCLLASAHQNGLAQFVIDRRLPAIEAYLKTSCGMLSICIGRFFPKLRKLYPNEYVDLHFHTQQSPQIEMSREHGVNVSTVMAVDIHLNPYVKTKKNVLARLLVESTTSIDEPVLNRTKVHGNLTNFEVTVREEFSNIGDVSQAFLRAFSNILAMTAKQAVRSVLAIGIPIPMIDNVTVSDRSTIQIFDRYTRVNVDFKYV